jgi:serine/threonine protein kinase
VRRERIAHYRVEGLLGAGGMGEVWSAFDEKLERRVAIKTLPEDRASDDARARMVREARAAGALHHPGIVPIYDVGEIDGVSYIVMEWVEGETLAARLDRTGAMAPADAVELVAQAADALGVAHEAGIVHRDVKTANLMIDARGRVRVLDFGLSKRRGASLASTVLDEPIDPTAPTVAPSSPSDGWALATDRTLPATSTPGADVASSPVSSRGSRDPVTAFGSRMGTPGYAAPELIAGGEADARSDVFSLAVVLYELVTGARPFPADTWGELERAMKAGPVPPSRASRGAVGSGFDAALSRALAPRRADRYATVGELIDAARAALAPARPARRGRAWLLAGGAAAAIAGGAAIVLASGGTRATAPSDPPPAPPKPPPAPPKPPPALFAGAPRALTSLGGCAEGPVFADDHTVVFDLARGGTVDVWAVGRDGKNPHAIATGPGWNWRVSPGRTPGEIVYLRSDQHDEQRSAVIAIDAATGAEHTRIKVITLSATAAGGAIYTVSGDGTEVHRHLGDRDESWLTLPSELAAWQLVISSRGVAGFTSNAPGAPGHLCTAAPGTAPSCIAMHATAGARPDFSRDGAGLYFDAADGIFRHDLATKKDRLVLAGARALSGLGVSPDGRSLVYSECAEHVRLVDVTKPDAAIVDDEHTTSPVFGPDGQLAWVHQDDAGDRLELRRKDGTIAELVPPKFGRITQLAFDDGGHRIAFVAGGDHPGIHVAFTQSQSSTLPVTQLTDGATDYHPHFTRDHRVVFTRVDDRNVPQVFAVPVDGGTAKRTSPATRDLRAEDPATGKMLIYTGVSFLWWDPVTDELGASIPGPKPIREIAVSPNGRWLTVQTGMGGLTIWRGTIAHPEAMQKLADLPADWTVDAPAIDDDGRVIAPVSRWGGELKIADAAPAVTL